MGGDPFSPAAKLAREEFFSAHPELRREPLPCGADVEPIARCEDTHAEWLRLNAGTD